MTALPVLELGSQYPLKQRGGRPPLHPIWYHSDFGESWPIGMMVCDLAELPGVVEAGLRQGLGDMRDILGLDDAMIDSAVASVMPRFGIRLSETGCSGDPSTYSELADGFQDAETFQAFEVWRRLGGALASGAEAVSWHSWVDGEGDTYVGYGLRQKDGSESGDPDDTTPRASWYAYQRLCSLLGGVVRGRMLLPEVADRRELFDLIRGRPAPLEPTVVFEYELSGLLPGGYRYAYMVFLDPTVDGLGYSDLFPQWHSSSGVVKRQSVEPNTTTVTTYGDGRLPVGEASYDGEQDFPVGLAVRVEAGQLPLLVLSTALIDWRICSGILGQVEGAVDPTSLLRDRNRWGGVEPMDRPAWMDDPGEPLPPRRP